MKAIVVGGAGFIGSHLVDRLVADGHEVLVIDNFLTGLRENVNPKATVLEMDIRESLPAFVFKGYDWVFLTAAIARTPWCIKDPKLCYETNIMGVLNVLERARADGVKRVVYSSSNIVYGNFTPYRSSKMAAEMTVEVYSKLYKLSAISLVYSNVYGTRQREDGISPNVFASLRAAKRQTGRIWITGDGSQTRQYTHVSDIVEANILAAKSNFNGRLDICHPNYYTMNEVAKFFDCPIDYVEEREGDAKDLYQDASKAEDVLGFKAKTPLEEGIKECII